MPTLTEPSLTAASSSSLVVGGVGDGALVVPHGDGLEGLGDHVEGAVDLRAVERHRKVALERGVAGEELVEVGDRLLAGVLAQVVVRGDEHVGAFTGGDVGPPLGEDLVERLLDDVDGQAGVRGADLVEDRGQGAGLTAAGAVGVPEGDLALEGGGRGLLTPGRPNLGRRMAAVDSAGGGRASGGRAAGGGDDRHPCHDARETKVLLHRRSLSPLLDPVGLSPSGSQQLVGDCRPVWPVVPACDRRG